MLIQKFTTLFKDVTRQGTKIPKEEYLTHGKNIIIDQGQDIIAGYTCLLYTSPSPRDCS